MATLQLYFLGPLDMRSGGQPLPRPPTLKSQSLLAYLALHRDQPQARDRLVGLFWGEKPELNARRSLSTGLWHIRRCLPDERVLVSDTHTVQFDPGADLWLDVEEFKARASCTDVSGLQSALTLYRGDLLDGFYDDWIQGERYRLEALFIEALARLMAGYEAAGDHQGALATALHLLSRDPLREDAYRLTMRAYCRLGRRNAALRQYERCCEIVRAELRAEPTGETRSLYSAILGGEFRVGAVTETASTEPPPLARLGRSPLDVIAPVRLVGREREMGLLSEAWQAARASQGRFVFISGEAGLGKTRLVEEFGSLLRRQGARVLCGRCYEFERVLPYQPLAEALHAALPALSDEETAAFPPWALNQVARLVPEVQGRPVLPVSGPHAQQCAAEWPVVRREYEGHAEDAWDQADRLGLDREHVSLFEGVTHVLAAMASRIPMLLVLEDLHWASESTLGLLHHLIRHLAEYPVLILGTYRLESVAADHPLQALRRRLLRDGLARELKLSRLSAEAVETVVVEMSGAGKAAVPLARRLYRETEGNPFFLIELIKSLFEANVVRLEQGTWQCDFAGLCTGALSVPARVSEAIKARTRRLERSAHEAVGLAAVLGREFDFDLLNAAWGRGEEATLEALDSLLRHRLIEETAGTGGRDFAFTHHKIQEVVYEGLAHRRRLYWHACVGKAMETLYASVVETRAGELAYHFERACLIDRSLCDRAIGYLLQAGQQAVRQSANQEAIAYYSRGLELLQNQPETNHRVQQEIELQIALGQPTAVVYGYAAPETRRVYNRARDLCRRLGETPDLVTSLAGLARYYGLGGNAETAREIAEEVLAIALTAQDKTLLVEAYWQMGGRLFAEGRLRDARAMFERGLAFYDPAQHETHAYRFGHDPGASFLAYLSMTLWLLGYPDQAQTRSRELSSLMRSMTHASSLAYAHSMLAMHACVSHDTMATLDHAEAAMTVGHLHGLPNWSTMALALHGWAMIQVEEVARGLAELEEGMALWRARGFAHLVPFFLSLHAEACLQMSRPKEASVALSTAWAIVRNGGDRYWTPELHRLGGELARADGGDGKEAETHFRQAIHAAGALDAMMLELRAATSLACLWRRQGRPREAHDVLAQVYTRFDEGLNSCDLQAAGTLLETLV